FFWPSSMAIRSRFTSTIRKAIAWRSSSTHRGTCISRCASRSISHCRMRSSGNGLKRTPANFPAFSPSPIGAGSFNRASSSETEALLQLILNLRDAGFSAGFFLGLSVRSAAQPDGADRVITDHDRNSAAQRNDIAQAALSEDVTARLGTLRPLGRRSPERQRSVRLPPRQLEVVWRCV